MLFLAVTQVMEDYQIVLKKRLALRFRREPLSNADEVFERCMARTDAYELMVIDQGGQLAIEFTPSSKCHSGKPMTKAVAVYFLDPERFTILGREFAP